MLNKIVFSLESRVMLIKTISLFEVKFLIIRLLKPFGFIKSTWNKCLFVLIFILGACKSEPTLADFNQERWKKDRNACLNLRKDLIKSLFAQKDKIKGLGQNQIMRLLGRPDYQELYNRNQRFYVYFYEKGEQCQGKPNLVMGKNIQIRFSALDAVTEVLLKGE
jgi:outer membrane protein assembly factor BamE (lipoprotein component of BamABCDE complex)